MPRRTLGWPITLGVTMIALVVALTVGWVILNVRQATFEAQRSGVYWTVLTVGTVFLVLLILGVVSYLTISVSAINLNQRQSNFIDAVTHELKSPIASLKLYLQTLGRRQVDERQQADFYRFMLADVERLDQLINHLLDAARLEQPPEEPSTDDVDLTRLLTSCLELVQARYHLPPEALELALAPVAVRGRETDLEMIFRNLLDNSVKYGGSPPWVRVETAAASPGRIVVRISDNGSGIPAILRRKIFNRFVRLGSELERKKPGTGLGLYIVRTLVERLGGRVTVRDRAKEPGTLFEVQLPGRVLADQAPASPPPAAETPP